MKKVLRFFRYLGCQILAIPGRRFQSEMELCYYVEVDRHLSNKEFEALRWLLSETFEPNRFSDKPFFKPVIEIGPRLNFETSFSTNAVAICHACGISAVTRLECSRRYLFGRVDKEKFLQTFCDRMTEMEYTEPLQSFEVNLRPEPVYEIPLLKEGVKALSYINKKLGLGMDAWDLNFYTKLFVKDFGRNPTNVECFQLGQANSEHSRHWFFKGIIEIDGVKMQESLLDIVRSTLKLDSNSLIAFHDNSSAIHGFSFETLIPQNPGRFSPFQLREVLYHLIFTAETHNFPSGVAPFPGAETGTGGRIRDVQATGKGALVIAGTAAYCTGNLLIPGYRIPGEDGNFLYPANLASPLEILIQASNGASRYGNEFGEPVINGFARTFGLKLPSGERREWIKPIMFTGGIGQIDNKHLEKNHAQSSMLIVQIGGPAYRIGVGGGSASSMTQGENTADLDFNAVQRGNAEMEQKMNRVIRACIEMGPLNPIETIHDQGAGGPCNVCTELVEPAGGKIDIREIILGDKTLSVLEIWSAEYQERNALLIRPENLSLFVSICQREKVNCEVLGEVTGNGKIVLIDSANGTAPVNLQLSKILGKMPQKTFSFNRIHRNLEPLSLPKGLSLEKALKMVLQLPSVGSKGFLTRKVDRSVTGLVAQQQCCGPYQAPVSDFGIVAQSHFYLTGGAISIGEQPIKMLVNPAAGARMAVGEMLTNLAGALITDLIHIKCSANWMAAGKLDDEGARIYDAALAVRDLMDELDIAIDGGKDSLSMAAKVFDEMVKSPTELVISGYASMYDITRKATPDIKKPGNSALMFLDLAAGKNRMGGSALAQAFSQIGDESPDVDDFNVLRRAFLAIQRLLKEDLIFSLHDRSDGGLITTLIEMAISGNCGLDLNIVDEKNDIFSSLFSEELGFVFEFYGRNANEITRILSKYRLEGKYIGGTTVHQQVDLRFNGQSVLSEATSKIRGWWEKTSFQLEKIQTNPSCAEREYNTLRQFLPNPKQNLSFKPKETLEFLDKKSGPKIAIIREEGSNGDREMSSAFFMAGFEVYDVNMMDLVNGLVNLDLFNMIAFVGGFSYADVLDSAKGWAGVIKFNDRLRGQTEKFYSRPDTLSFGVCNGFQLMTLLKWVPGENLDDLKQPRLIQNVSKRFESRWSFVKVLKSPAVMLREMEGSILGVPVAHGEGKLHFPDPEIFQNVKKGNLFPLAFVDQHGRRTERYPFNPNGSPGGFTALCTADGRHLAMMPHPERAFLKWQWHWMPENWKEGLSTSPWMKIFQNAYDYFMK